MIECLSGLLARFTSLSLSYKIGTFLELRFCSVYRIFVQQAPMVIVGTLSQGYPLLLYEAAVPVRRSLAAR
jgi:hypothetical protein